MDSIFIHTMGLTYSDHIVSYVGGGKKKLILRTQTEATLEGKIKRGRLFAVGVNNPSRLGECRKVQCLLAMSHHKASPVSPSA